MEFLQMKNKNLNKAKTAKNDEFYTQYEDIEKELIHYKDHLKDKVILCNCDDPTFSNFWAYFHKNFETLKLQKLISTHYHTSKPVYAKIYTGGSDEDISTGEIIPLHGTGDFRSEECIEYLKQADIVCTNPPFSLFREYVAQLMEYEKKFLIIGNQNAITYKEIFPLIRNNEMWWGASDCIRWFVIPDHVDMMHKMNRYNERIAEGARSRWFTNLDHKKRHEELDLYKHYSPKEFPKYDNYDAINVDKVSEIPLDYDGVIGVPITFLDKYKPTQFEIVAFRKGDDGKNLSVNGKCPYCRILIRRKEISK